MKKMFYTLIASMLATTQLNAAEDVKDDSPWTTEAELGYVSTTGNTETQTTTARLNSSYEVEKWRHTLRAEAFGQESEDSNTGETVVSAERYLLSGKSDYKFTERDYAFGLLRLTKDRFSGFEYEHTVSAGYGRKVLKREDMELDIEVGPGMRFYKVDDAPESEEEGVLRLAGKYWWDISKNSRFSQDLMTEIGEEFTTTESITGLTANINSTLAMRLAYTIRHKSDVPPDIEKTDTETSVTLVYNF